jgi:NAD(P)-dependent dehydrogenase (short-subunit alcohol dehydrogenase family)
VGDLTDKTIIVSGVGPGLGRETALVAVREGARVVLGARTQSTLAAVAAEVDPSGERVAHAVTDVTSDHDCHRLAATAVERFGGIDALVNCAALDTVFGGLEAAGDFSEWHRTLDVNLFGSMQMTRAALPEMRKRGGGIVFVSSQTQHAPTPLAIQMAYAASKSALTGAMRYLAVEVGGDGIRVNEVAPGWMWGPPVEGFVKAQATGRGVSPDEVADEIAAGFPLRRMATDGEVAETIVFLASPRAGGITGQTLLINAGEVMH